MPLTAPSSEVVGRPLAALLANDGARVFSVDVDGVQEFNKRKPASASAAGTSTSTNGSSASKAAAQLPHHVVRASKYSLDECLKQSDVVITGVPSASYKIPTASLRDGVIAVNFSSEKNFESDIKEKVPAVSDLWACCGCGPAWPGLACLAGRQCLRHLA